MHAFKDIAGKQLLLHVLIIFKSIIMNLEVRPIEKRQNMLHAI